VKVNKGASFPTRLRLGFVVVSWISPCVLLIVNVVKIFIDTNWAYWVYCAAKERMDLMKDVSDRVRKLPFAVARSSRATLVEQVVDGLRQCILSGFYKVGDILPTTRDLATQLGVSRIVTRAAIAELTREELINPKPGVGCMVLGRSGKVWKGNVLFITRSNGRTYYVNVFTSILRERLVSTGWRFTQVTVTPDSKGHADVSELDLWLSHPVTLAIVMFDNPAAERILSRSGVPFVTLGNKTVCRTKGCVGHVQYDRTTAAEELAAEIKKVGVESVLQVGMEKFDDVAKELHKVDISLKRWEIPPTPGGKLPQSLSFAVRDAFAERISKSRKWLPDLIYFSDDHACVGALAALTAAGVRIPEDVRVVTWSNAGNEPVYAKELTRIEMDPEDDAGKFAEAILLHLEGCAGAFPITLVPEFRKGASL